MVKRSMIVLASLSLFMAACGSGDGTADDVTVGEQTDPTSDGDGATTTTAAATTTTEAGGSIADVEASVVQIRAQGSFVTDSGQLALNNDSTGTGFVISDDGLVVTNNHVVTGAATLEVFFSDSEQPINARQLGVSECSDLAVIQLVGDGYQALEFRDEEITVGLPIFAAGFPGADEFDFDDLDYTLTSGIVGSVDADGETNWASVDGVLQHDAQILGGNSGGPLVDEQGRVVGVNYAGSLEFNTNFAISAEIARPVIDQLVQDIDVDSLGINGEAVVGDFGSGVFVRSIESGSPADGAGIEPGDLIISLENLLLGTDGTMADYCDVLRTKGPTATMNVEVFRPDLGLVLTGQINGEPIELPAVTAAVMESGGVDETAGAADVIYEYTTITDDSGLISVSIPTAWTDVNGANNPDFGPSIWASPDIQGWQETWAVPGIIVESAPDLTSADIPALLETRDFSEVCVDQGASPYDDGLYAGTIQVYSDCGGSDTVYVVVAASPLDPALDYLVRVEIQAVTPADLDAADQALNTFIANI
jgi:serine protease Do